MISLFRFLASIAIFLVVSSVDASSRRLHVAPKRRTRDSVSWGLFNKTDSNKWGNDLSFMLMVASFPVRGSTARGYLQPCSPCSCTSRSALIYCFLHLQCGSCFVERSTKYRVASTLKDTNHMRGSVITVFKT